VSVCRSCDAPVRWAVVAASNKRMPLDPDPDPEGNVILLEGGTVRVLTAAALAIRHALPGGPGPLYRSHFSSCVHAAQHRKPR